MMQAEVLSYRHAFGHDTGMTFQQTMRCDVLTALSLRRIAWCGTLAIAATCG